MTVHERAIGDVTILDVDGRITVQEGATVFREALSRLLDGADRKSSSTWRRCRISTALRWATGARYTSAAKRGGGLRLLQGLLRSTSC